MTNLGMKIVGTKMEVGFTATTREEFDDFVGRLTMMAATVWPASPAGARGVGDDEEPTRAEADFGNYAQERAANAAKTSNWRETQGLR